MTLTKNKKLCLIAIVCAALVLLCVELFVAPCLKATVNGNTFYEIIVRAVGIAVFTILTVAMGYGKIFAPKLKMNFSCFIFLCGCFLIAINNFPFAALFDGKVYVAVDWIGFAFYGLLCLFVGGFEEIAFRGFLFMLLLDRGKKNTKGAFLAIVLSSVVFGVVHSVNLLSGAGAISVILQIGYSSLIGALASVMLLKTHNIWYCIVLHALYNFNGGLVDRFGVGNMWTPSQVALTATVAVLVAVWVIYEFIRIPEEKIKTLFENGEKIC